MPGGFVKKESLNTLFEEFKKYNYIDPALNEKYDVKRGLRNSDGTGVLAGLTQICNVHGYVINECEKQPVDGELTFRGVNIRDLVHGCNAEQRFGYEEVAYLLLFGSLPDRKQLEFFKMVLSQARALPTDFIQDMVIKAPSKDIMNKMGRSILALYSLSLIHISSLPSPGWRLKKGGKQRFRQTMRWKCLKPLSIRRKSHSAKRRRCCRF